MADRKNPAPSEDGVFPATWYAVCFSAQITRRRPLAARVAGRDLVLFRDASGRVHALSRYCTHRGADLALGRVEGAHLACAYHGWQFCGDGRCIQIPAHPDRPIPDFAHTRAYATCELAGMTWVYLGGEARPPELRVFSELTDGSYRLVPYEDMWQAHLTRVVESVLDVAHLAFVHRKTIGRRTPAAIPRLSFETDGGDRILIRNGGGVLEYWFPQMWVLRPSEGRGGFLNFVTFTPVDEGTTRILGYAGRTFARSVPGMDALFRRYSLRVLREDQRVVESQHPRPIPEALRMEAHVPADAPQVRFRHRWYRFLTGDEPRVTVEHSDS
ncbi:aromatic ring-hydroxylating oxygenase subunit alpha [Alicyclobacillus mali (ex Roth et al. 2021)]|uniref:aromatic ring-hydroxylating oxygenase subunit alpha n=1 Tax=Alicyclobacillus mali (ex Roth et al. 2021) TaxID=1123961 RepID=UPI00082D23E8|nr:aromatic ring-hydroxylating dioxygenase subunit alpha [Alicyclobacillus mali (ex Roth et al. 2021)]MCL6487546.1 aromatic ring-hydroxylating dioxygenase subunit alpha [Alicyclobacillus mali (ex Roth et al. 2021)]